MNFVVIEINSGFVCLISTGMTIMANLKNKACVRLILYNQNMNLSL